MKSGRKPKYDTSLRLRNEYLPKLSMERFGRFGDVLYPLIKSRFVGTGKTYELHGVKLAKKAGYKEIDPRVFLATIGLTPFAFQDAIGSDTVVVPKSLRSGKWFCYQPCNSQRALDLILINNGKILAVEFKASNGPPAPEHNSGDILSPVLYLISANDPVEMTYYCMGEFYPIGDAIRLLDEYYKELETFKRKWQTRFKSAKNNHLGRYNYERPMWKEHRLDSAGFDVWVDAMQRTEKILKSR